MNAYMDQNISVDRGLKGACDPLSKGVTRVGLFIPVFSLPIHRQKAVA